jgi:hypothetical protein
MSDKEIPCIPLINQNLSPDVMNTSTPILEDSKKQIKSKLPSQSPEEISEPTKPLSPEIESSTSSIATRPEINVPMDTFQPNEWAKQVWNHPARFKQICWHRRARKTTLAINKLIKEACLTEKRTYAYIGPTYAQAKGIVWRDPMMLKRYLPRELLNKDPNETELYCEFNSGSVLQIRGADDPDSLRGVGYAGVIFDEWAMMKPAIWEEIIYPVLAANGGWAWFLFTPKGRNHAYHYWNNARQWKDWQNFFLDVNSSGIVSPEELERAKSEMPEDLYKQEFLCNFLEGAGSVFKGINMCITGSLEDVKPGHRYVIGFDVAKTVDFNVLICVDQGTNQVVAFDRFNQTSWAYQKERAAIMARKYNDALIIIDSTGVGDPILEDLQRMNLKVEGFKFNQNSKEELVERLMLAISQRMIYFPIVRELLDELESYTYEILPSGRFRYNAPAGQHDDCVMALGLALFGLHGNLYKRSSVGSPVYKQAVKYAQKPMFAFKGR